MGKPRHDWNAIKHEYVTTDCSTKELSEKYKIRYATVRKKCADEGWVEARKGYKHQVGQQTIQITSQKEAEARSDTLACVRAGAGLAAHKIYLMLIDKDWKPTDIEHLMNALEAAERLERSVGGILTVAQERKLKIEEERLKLEQQKAEQNVVDKDITIRIEGYQGEWSE